MNWPALSPECSRAIAEVLEEVVESKPKNLLWHVAERLQERSGLDPVEFEAHFEECKRRPRTFVLEERCPPNQDPMSWVPMRYNDDTIRLTLSQRVYELISDVLSNDPVEDMRDLVDRACVAFPETMYLRGSPEEVVASQTVRAIFLGCTGSPDVLDRGSLDDADPALAFGSAELLESARNNFFEPATLAESMTLIPQSEAILDALFVCCLFRVLGANAGFQARYGGGLTVPEQAALHAVAHEREVLPSFQRLMKAQKDLIVAVLKAHCPIDLVASSEAVPAHFLRVKELLSPIDGALRFGMAVASVERLVQCRATQAKGVEYFRLGGQCILALEKYTAPRAYEMYLKKRAERHAWRLVKDDLATRTVIRLCCLARLEETDAWNQMQKTFEGLSNQEQQALKTEIGRKDGVGEMQAYVLLGASALLEQACGNGQLGAAPALRLLVRILEDAGRACVRLANNRMVPIHLESLGALARNYRTGGPLFEDTPFVLEEAIPGEIVLRIPGSRR